MPTENEKEREYLKEAFLKLIQSLCKNQDKANKDEKDAKDALERAQREVRECDETFDETKEAIKIMTKGWSRIDDKP